MKNGKEKEQLFKGLWVEKNAPQLLEKELPVLMLDFSQLESVRGIDALRASLHTELGRIAETFQVPDKKEELPNFVKSIVLGAAQQTKENKVVLLIDEVITHLPPSQW